jgi:hypothetical protein
MAYPEGEGKTAGEENCLSGSTSAKAGETLKVEEP